MPWDAKRDALREDASYLVQTSAIDSLSAFPGDDTLAAAMRLSASRHPLVRGYAYICVGMAGRSLGDEERAGLRNRLSAIRETDTLLPDYKTARTEAQEYETVKQNVDALQAVPKEQEQQRRHELE